MLWRATCSSATVSTFCDPATLAWASTHFTLITLLLGISTSDGWMWACGKYGPAQLPINPDHWCLKRFPTFRFPKLRSYEFDSQSHKEVSKPRGSPKNSQCPQLLPVAWLLWRFLGVASRVHKSFEAMLSFTATICSAGYVEKAIVCMWPQQTPSDQRKKRKQVFIKLNTLNTAKPCKIRQCHA
jgi:hypothetical protein